MRTVLIVEDEWAIADWLHALLGDEGYRVLVASNGKRALDLLREQRPDVLLTDFMMPVMDGPALLTAMRRDGMADIPVVVMSSLPEATVIQRLQGHQAFVRKPFRECDLLEVLERVLNSGGKT